MSSLTSSTVVSWSGVSVNGNASSSSRCHGRVGAERVALRGLPGGVELDQLGRDLAHRLAGPALALAPVGAAEPVEAGLLAADVAGHLVERVGGDVEPVRRSAALAGAVLEDEVLADRAGDLALLHLDEPADAVLLVDDVVAGGELERVDLALAAGRHPAHVAGGRALAGDVLAGEQDQPVGLVDEAVGERATGHRDHVGRGRVLEHVDQPGRDVELAERLDGALGRAVAGVHDDRAETLGTPAREVGERAVDVAAVGVGGLHRQGAGRARPTCLCHRGPAAPCLGVVGEPERADRPPAWPAASAWARTSPRAR